MGKPEMKIKGQGVTVFVFLNLLIRVAGGIAIATDAFHSPDGRRFWLRRIAQAFSDKKHVYLIDMEKNKKVKVNTDKEFEQKMNDMKMWVKSEKGQERRVIISTSPIKW